MGVGHEESMGTVRLSLGHGSTKPDILQVVRDLCRAFEATYGSRAE